MSKKRFFDTKFWSDVWVVEELNPLDRYVFLYFLLNERTTLSGTYQLSLRTAANETGMDRDELERMLKRLYPRVVAADGWVILTNAIKHQNYRSPRIEPVILSELDKLPIPLLRYVNLPADFAMERGSDLRLRVMMEKKNDTVSITYTHKDLDLDKDLDIKDTSYPMPVSEEIEELKPVKKPKPMADGAKRVPSETINGMFTYWESFMGEPIGEGKMKKNREYCGKLIKAYSKQDIAQMIQAVAVARTDQYAPSVADFVDLYWKWDRMKLWMSKKTTSINNNSFKLR